MRSFRSTIGGLILTVGLAGAAFAHPDSGVTMFAPHIPGPINIDGNIDDWVEWFPEAAVVTTEQSFPHVCAEANCDVVPEDFDWNIRLAWDDGTNRLYFSVEVFDDSWTQIAEAGHRSLHEADDLEIISDPDNSGGEIGSTKDEDGIAGRRGQQWYFNQGAPGEGTRLEVIYGGSEALAVTWVGQPPYGDSAFSRDGNRGVYEAWVRLFDWLSENGPDDSIEHDLTADETIGFGFLYDEIDGEAGSGYDAQWKTAEGTSQWGDANQVPDVLLLPPGDGPTAVDPASWGNLKAGHTH
jgi:hypothetical protein